MRQRMCLFVLILFLLTSGCGPLSTPSPTSTPISTATAEASHSPDRQPPTPVQGEWAIVVRVVDGDTVELDNGHKVRYVGLNTPEQGQPFYEEAKEANRQLVEGKQVLLEFDITPYDIYGRWLAYLFVDGRFVNYELIRRGFANVYTVPPNVKYNGLLRQAERQAREEGVGLWASVEVGVKIIHIEADAPGDDNDNPNGEWLEITSQGTSSIDLTGYTLKDEANHIYTFGPFQLAPGATVRLHSGPGEDTEKELYWGFVGQAVWNNGGDTAYLRDPQGNLVDVYAY